MPELVKLDPSEILHLSRIHDQSIVTPNLRLSLCTEEVKQQLAIVEQLLFNFSESNKNWTLLQLSKTSGDY